jgi:small-conductance mechanosensitive channel
VPTIPSEYQWIVENLVTSLAVVLLLLAVNHFGAQVMKRRIRDRSHSHTLRMLLRNSTLFLGALAVVLIWSGLGANLTVALGIFGAGIAFASQEVIGSFSGYLNIVVGGLFHIGDRVLMGEVTGDVLDISIMRTTLMEIGEWVRADQYTGRIVTVANRVIFTSPVYNYTEEWPYIWDEIMIPITYGSDWRHTAEIMLEHGRHYTERFQAQAEADLSKLMVRYPVHESPVAPVLYTTMTDNWIEMVLRYVVGARERRGVRAQLNQELLEHFQAESGITVASATFEIVGFPPLRGDLAASSPESAGAPTRPDDK